MSTLVTPLPEFITQDFDAYDAEAHEVWSLLYALRMATLEETASHVFLDGIARIGLDAHRAPDLLRPGNPSSRLRTLASDRLVSARSAPTRRA